MFTRGSALNTGYANRMDVCTTPEPPDRSRNPPNTRKVSCATRFGYFAETKRGAGLTDRAKMVYSHVFSPFDDTDVS